MKRSTEDRIMETTFTVGIVADVAVMAWLVIVADFATAFAGGTLFGTLYGFGTLALFACIDFIDRSRTPGR